MTRTLLVALVALVALAVAFGPRLLVAMLPDDSNCSCAGLTREQREMPGAQHEPGCRSFSTGAAGVIFYTTTTITSGVAVIGSH